MREKRECSVPAHFLITLPRGNAVAMLVIFIDISDKKNVKINNAINT